MAIAGQWQAAHFNRPGFEMFDYDVYAVCGDGCLMEGVSNEAASLAGYQKLANLCWVYDNNHISIDGSTTITYTDDVHKRFAGYGWKVFEVHDANDLEELTKAFDDFRANRDSPTLIVVDSHIGYGSPHKVDTAEAHGEPLGEEEVRETKRNYGWPEDAQFLVPDGVIENFAGGIGKRGLGLREAWESRFDDYHREDETLAHQLGAMQRRELPEGWDSAIPSFPADEKGMATRKASNQVENAVAEHVPWLLAGSADLTGSTSVELEGSERFEPGNRAARQLHYGIREHESAAISNGLALGKLRPVWSTLPGLLRLRAPGDPPKRPLMELPVNHLFTPRLDRARRGRPDPPAR